MSEPLILTFDVGTQSMRGMLINPKGEIINQARCIYPTPYFSPNPNWAEQDAEYYFTSLCETARALEEKAPSSFREASAVVVTVFRDSVVCLDKDGNPLTNLVLWMDQRKVKNPKPLPLSKKLLFDTVGMHDTIDMVSRTCVCNWIAENQPEIWAKTDKYVMLSTFLNLRLTGVLKDSIAGQTGHVPFDYKNRCWDKNGLTRCLYDIPQEKLCEVVPSGTVIGTVTAAASAASGIPEGLPLIATGADKACETLGLGVIHENQAALSFGTSCTVQVTTKKYFEPVPFMPAYPAVPNDLYNGEVQLLRGYWMLTWFKENFATDEVRQAGNLGCSAEELLNKRLADVPAGCDGLMVLPHWTPGLSTPKARGAMVGFSDVHTRYHIYRAIIEGLNFGLMEGLDGMKKQSGLTISEIRVAGGGSRSSEICQLTADMFGLPVSRIQTHEACALGAAMCAFVSMGVYKDYDEAIAGMVRLRDTFQPDAECHAFYDKLYQQVFRKLYKTMSATHGTLAALTKRKETI